MLLLEFLDEKKKSKTCQMETNNWPPHLMLKL